MSSVEGRVRCAKVIMCMRQNGPFSFSNIMTQPTLILLQMSFSSHNFTLYFLLRIGSLVQYGCGCHAARGIFVITRGLTTCKKFIPFFIDGCSRMPLACLLVHPRTAAMSRHIGVNVNVGGSANATVERHWHSPQKSERKRD